MPIGTPLSQEIQVTHLVSAFTYELPADFAYEGERHPGWEFVYVHSGKARITADDLTYVLKSGEMVCHKPMEFHTIRPYQGAVNITVFCFQCAGEKMAYFNNKILLLAPRQKQYIHDIAEKAAQIFWPKSPLAIAADKQMDCRPDADPAAGQYVKNTIELLILSLMTAESADRRQRSEFYELATQRQTLTADIIHYLHEHIAQPVRLQDISTRFSYSLSSIKRIFRQETGCGVMEYLAHMRIEQAKRLLTESRLPLGEIALNLGFSNVYYFSNAFKKKTGQRPGEYRRDHHR